MKKLHFEYNDSGFCCGLTEIGGFGMESVEPPHGWGDYRHHEVPETATFATTIRSQRAAIRELKKLGFEPLKKFRGNGRSIITLWFYIPERRKVRGAVAPKPKAKKNPGTKRRA